MSPLRTSKGMLTMTVLVDIRSVHRGPGPKPLPSKVR